MWSQPYVVSFLQYGTWNEVGDVSLSGLQLNKNGKKERLQWRGISGSTQSACMARRHVNIVQLTEARDTPRDKYYLIILNRASTGRYSTQVCHISPRALGLQRLRILPENTSSSSRQRRCLGRREYSSYSSACPMQKYKHSCRLSKTLSPHVHEV